jgi:hypothetical protein
MATQVLGFEEEDEEINTGRQPAGVLVLGTTGPRHQLLEGKRL